jgi:hypothetical protein
MNVSQILTTLQQGTAMAEALAPILAMTGPQGAAAAALITGLGKYADAVLEGAQEAHVVLSSDDLAAIQAAVADLKAKNVVVAQEIADS